MTKSKLVTRCVLGAMSFGAVIVAAAGAAPQQAEVGAGTPTPAAAETKSIVPSDSVATFYMVPMIGQMGTDVHKVAYEDIIEDIKKKNPDVLVFVLNSADLDKQEYIQQEDPDEEGMILIDDYRELVQVFRDRIPSNIRQIMWVEDSVGISSLIAMAWPEMYMKPGARLFGLSILWQISKNWADKDVRMKMMAAFTGIGKGFLEYGGHNIQLGEAMMRPERVLSCSFVGRSVMWMPSEDGEIVLDNSKESTLGFNAKTAEDFEISRGTAETLDDLAFLLGYREFRVVQDLETSPCVKYKEDWRRQFDNCKEWYMDFRQHMGRAGGDEALKWLGAAKSDLEKIKAAVERYEAVENRLSQGGLSLRWLNVQIDTIKERIIGLKNAEKGNRNRGGSGGGNGGGGRSPKTFWSLHHEQFPPSRILSVNL